MTAENEHDRPKRPTAPPPGPFEDGLAFVYMVCLGTGVAGAVFGLFAAASEPPGAWFLGLMFGFVFAMACAVPIQATVSVLTWAFWLSRIRVVTAAIGGATTGLAATCIFFPGSGSVAAGVLGALGGGLAGVIYDKKRLFRSRSGRIRPTGPWQFTLRDLLVRTTVLAMLLSFWTSILRALGKL